MSAAGREVSFSGEAGLNSAPACIPVEDLRPGARARGARVWRGFRANLLTPSKVAALNARDLRAERDSGRSRGSGSKGLEDYIERAMVRARRASMLQPNSDAVNPEARCRADRPY